MPRQNSEIRPTVPWGDWRPYEEGWSILLSTFAYWPNIEACALIAMETDPVPLLPTLARRMDIVDQIDERISHHGVAIPRLRSEGSLSAHLRPESLLPLAPAYDPITKAMIPRKPNDDPKARWSKPDRDRFRALIASGLVERGAFDIGFRRPAGAAIYSVRPTPLGRATLRAIGMSLELAPTFAAAGDPPAFPKPTDIRLLGKVKVLDIDHSVVEQPIVRAVGRNVGKREREAEGDFYLDLRHPNSVIANLAAVGTPGMPGLLQPGALAAHCVRGSAAPGTFYPRPFATILEHRRQASERHEEFLSVGVDLSRENIGHEACCLAGWTSLKERQKVHDDEERSAFGMALHPTSDGWTNVTPGPRQIESLAFEERLMQTVLQALSYMGVPSEELVRRAPHRIFPLYNHEQGYSAESMSATLVWLPRPDRSPPSKEDGSRMLQAIAVLIESALMGADARNVGSLQQELDLREGKPWTRATLGLYLEETYGGLVAGRDPVGWLESLPGGHPGWEEIHSHADLAPMVRGHYIGESETNLLLATGVPKASKALRINVGWSVAPTGARS